ncbi:helix-turn-helix domain-containing protein [Curtobacterium sp. ISL-83]|uniref:helix-turn-helix domain-containing protein n=1 Tax=Curtobacterium sp. ISL-83 TaxID=2819145 RepID=UPI001BE588BA|nr:helix-turn-helix domain-containing protein [Curtobacterium sp. ISL-83]MBT2503861.1 helix-turn-helix transcriptional regulator [Curtobacterium sp. ISL-83]
MPGGSNAAMCTFSGNSTGRRTRVIIDDAFATDEPDRAEALIRRLYHRVRLQEGSTPFRFRQDVRGDERANVARFRISAPAELEVDFEGVLGVGLRTSGRYRAASNGTEVDPDDAFLLRPGTGTSSSEDLDIVMVNLSVEALTRFASERTGTVLHFDGVAPLSPVHAARWRQAAEFAGGVLADRELLRHDLMRRTAVDALFATALTTFPIDVVERRTAVEGVVLSTAVRRAVTFIEDNADRPIGVEDIAAAARLSVRALQAAFQRTLSTTPSEHLRTVRLASARGDLLRADPGTTGVSSIARRWGFSNVGRFAARYRQEYGELPRQTLER